MKFRDTSLLGCYIVKSNVFKDHRGSFTKLYHEDIFEKNGIHAIFKEQYYTVSEKNVMRGMHFQIPPHDHSKLITCLSGRVLDVVLDLRNNSDTYGEVASFELTQGDGMSLFIPKGMAHGFLSLEENSGMLYSTTTVHDPHHDSGVRWDSFGFCWPRKSPIISDRDSILPNFSDFESPFLL